MLALQITADKDMFDLNTEYESGVTFTEAIIKALVGGVTDDDDD